ncbi:hypothetical protein B0H10DRAFT_1785151 [Mycena sp. CBHHK59/15]|nr:hypothetical protein B0H10DRAFT_1785151 [Mycena sp. CBHHK59/15]
MAAIELGNTIGALEISVLFSCFFMGMLSVQTYVYYYNFPNDALWIKLWVAILWFFELGHLISIAQSLYAGTITGWGNPEALVRFIGLAISPLLAGVVSTMVQLFFCRRIQVMGQPYFAAACCALTFLRFVASFATAIIGLTYHAIVPFLADWGWLMTTYISLGAAIDMLIPMCLCWKLRESRESSFSGTANMIDRLMLWTIRV